MDKRVLYFLEDRAQASFITALVERIAKESGVKVQHNVRSASHGSKGFKLFRIFVKDLRRRRMTEDFDVLVVGRDGNCNTYSGIIKEIKKVISGSGFDDKIAGCIPNPHIERWYLLDLSALKKAVGQDIEVTTPPYKCRRAKGFYKKKLGEALSKVGSILSGPEYGALIAQEIDFSLLESQDEGFKNFVNDLRRVFKS